MKPHAETSNGTSLRLLIGGLFATLVLLGSVGCSAIPVRAPVVPPGGGIYTHYRAPLQTEFANDGLGTNVSPSRKHGESDSRYIWIPLYFPFTFGFGDASIESAAQRGNISTIHYADYEYTSVLSIFAETKVIVYGE